MRCYQHQDRESVGICKSCGKGVCNECAVDLEKGLACRGRCEADAKAVIELVGRNIRLTRSINSRQQTVAAFFFISGAILLGSSLFVERAGIWAFVLGTCSIGYALMHFMLAREGSK